MDATGYGDFRARREATIWQRMNHILRVLLFLAVWLLIISFFLPPYKKLNQSRAEIDQLQAQLTEEKNLHAAESRPDLFGNDRARQARRNEGRGDDFPPRGEARRRAETLS